MTDGSDRFVPTYNKRAAIACKKNRTALQIALALVLAVAGLHHLSTTKMHTCVKPNVPYNLGNWTYVNKPVYPVKVDASQIPVSRNWTYVCPLDRSCSYHVYFYRDWIDTLTETITSFIRQYIIYILVVVRAAVFASGVFIYLGRRESK